jgi:hypothetical protein
VGIIVNINHGAWLKFNQAPLIGDSMKNILSVIITISLLISCSGSNFIYKSLPIYFDKDEHYTKEPFRVYFNLNALKLKDKDPKNYECMLWCYTSDDCVQKTYLVELKGIEKNDSLFYTDFVFPSDINFTNISFKSKKDFKSNYTLKLKVKNREGRIYRCEDDNTVRDNYQNNDTIAKYDKIERAKFPYNYRYRIHEFINIIRKNNSYDSVLKVLSDIESNVSSKPPQKLEDKLDYYSFMAAAYALVREFDNSIKYLKILENKEFDNCELMNSAAVINLSNIPHFFMAAPNPDNLSEREKELFLECMRAALNTKSVSLLATYNVIYSNSNLSRSNIEITSKLKDYILNIHANPNLKYSSSYFNAMERLNTVDDIFESNLVVNNFNKKILSIYCNYYNNFKFSKDTNDYYLFDNFMFIGQFAGQYLTLCEFYAKYDKNIDSLRHYYFEFENKLKFKQKAFSSLQYCSNLMKDYFINTNQIDSATYYLKKAYKYELGEMKYFRDIFDELNVARKKNGYSELNYEEFTAEFRGGESQDAQAPNTPQFRNLKDMGAAPSDIKFLNTMKDEAVFFLNVNEHCLACNSNIANVAQLVSAKINSGAKAKLYLISDLKDNVMYDLFAPAKYAKISKKSKAFNYLGFIPNYSMDVIIIKDGIVKYYKSIAADDYFVDKILKNGLK